DEQSRCVALATHRFHARLDYVGDLLDGILKVASRARQRSARSDTGGAENPLGAYLVQAVKIDVANVRHLRPRQGCESQQRQELPHDSLTRRGGQVLRVK